MILKNATQEYIPNGVGNYQLCFDGGYVLPLNKMIEDRLIHTPKTNFLVLRHATVDYEILQRMIKSNNNIVRKVNFNHDAYLLNDRKVYRIKSSVYNADLKYVSLENKVGEHSTFKIVLEFKNEDIDLCHKVTIC